MNALDKNSPKHEAQTSTNGPLFDLDYFIKKPEASVITPPTQSPTTATPDDVMVDISTDVPLASGHNNNNNDSDSPLNDILDLGLIDNVTKCDKTEAPVGNKESLVNEIEKRDNMKSEKGEVKPLTDINVTLASVRPSSVPPLTAFQEAGGLTVVLHFCRDRPRPDVNVIVISTTSNHTSPIEDYKFQAVVPKVIDCSYFRSPNFFQQTTSVTKVFLECIFHDQKTL